MFGRHEGDQEEQLRLVTVLELKSWGRGRKKLPVKIYSLAPHKQSVGALASTQEVKAGEYPQLYISYNNTKTLFQNKKENLTHPMASNIFKSSGSPERMPSIFVSE